MESIEEISRLSIDTTLKIGTTVNTYELYNLIQNNKKLKKIYNTNFKDETDFKVIEEKIGKLSDQFIKTAQNKKGNSYGELLRAGTFNPKQFRQLVVNIGSKPGLDGKIIPEIVNTNFLKGLRHSQDSYIMAETARKVLIISHRNIRSSGWK